MWRLTKEKVAGPTGHRFVLETRECDNQRMIETDDPREKECSSNQCWRNPKLIRKLVTMRKKVVCEQLRKAKTKLQENMRYIAATCTKKKTGQAWETVRQVRRQVWDKESPKHSVKVSHLLKRSQDCNKHPRCRELDNMWARRRRSPDSDSEEREPTQEPEDTTTPSSPAISDVDDEKAVPAAVSAIIPTAAVTARSETASAEATRTEARKVEAAQPAADKATSATTAVSVTLPTAVEAAGTEPAAELAADTGLHEKHPQAAETTAGEVTAAKTAVSAEIPTAVEAARTKSAVVSAARATRSRSRQTTKTVTAVSEIIPTAVKAAETKPVTVLAAETGLETTTNVSAAATTAVFATIPTAVEAAGAESAVTSESSEEQLVESLPNKILNEKKEKRRKRMKAHQVLDNILMEEEMENSRTTGTLSQVEDCILQEPTQAAVTKDNNNKVPPGLRDVYLTRELDLKHIDKECAQVKKRSTEFNKNLTTRISSNKLEGRTTPEMEKEDDVKIYGNVVLSEDEMELLRLGPGFMVTTTLIEEDMKTESNVTLIKMRWESMKSGKEDMPCR